jgi:hypothetical protein
MDNRWKAEGSDWEVVEGQNGYHLYFGDEFIAVVGDGTDMFFTEGMEDTITPGTEEFSTAMQAWVNETDDLEEAYGNPPFEENHATQDIPEDLFN